MIPLPVITHLMSNILVCFLAFSAGYITTCVLLYVVLGGLDLIYYTLTLGSLG